MLGLQGQHEAQCMWIFIVTNVYRHSQLIELNIRKHVHVYVNSVDIHTCLSCGPVVRRPAHNSLSSAQNPLQQFPRPPLCSQGYTALPPVVKIRTCP